MNDQYIDPRASDAGVVSSFEKAIVSEVKKTYRGLLTPEEWAEVVPPFYYIELNFENWGHLEYEIASKWLMANCTGWIYRISSRFIFEKEEDYVLFRLWADDSPMTQSNTVYGIK